ncbi:hypothetical protein ACF1A5_27785 [Streptomyces sp. NPDC014864]|uniref:hypothetical protein n=1 Tax=Streptomyces sp. NPDC014864 TaxID=3364924 RepID=UPI0037002A02
MTTAAATPVRPTTPPRKNSVHTPADPAVIPYVVQREGEEAAPDNLLLASVGADRYRLYYADEDPRDRTCAECCGRAARSTRWTPTGCRRVSRSGA